MGEILVPEGQLPRGWREAISAIARRSRDVFTRHPWALLSMQAAPPGPNAMRHFEQSLEGLEKAPMNVEGKLALLQLVDDFVFGHSLRTAGAGAWGWRRFQARAIRRGVRSTTLQDGRVSSHRSVVRGGKSRRAARHRQLLMEDRFEPALAALLDGAARSVSHATPSGRRRTSRRGTGAARR